MLSAIVICFDPMLLPYLRELVQQTGHLQVLRELTQQPTERELYNLLNAISPDIWLLDLGAGHDGAGIAEWLRAHAPGAAVIGVNVEASAPEFAEQSKHFPVLPVNATTADLHLAVRQAVQDRLTKVEQHLFCFLPCKGGAGASTIVVNTAAALARDFSKRVLVLDADLRSGVLAVMLGKTPETGLETLLTQGGELDLNRVQRALIHWQGVDLLCSQRSLDAAMPEWDAYVRLIRMVREQYDVILADFPELVNPASVEVVRRARMVYPVCTTELASLKLAQQRAEELARWQVPPERIGVVVNRWHVTDPSREDLSRVLGLPVHRTFPNDFPAVREAVGAAVPVANQSELGAAYSEFAAELVGEQARVQPRSFVRRLMRGLSR